MTHPRFDFSDLSPEERRQQRDGAMTRRLVARAGLDTHLAGELSAPAATDRTGIGADVGIYSTSVQWGQIVGQVSADSSLAGLPSWLAGARTANGAKNNCSSAPLTPGGYVSVTQFVSRGFDYDYSCI